MKTISEIVEQEPVFLNNWSSQDEVYNDFDVKVDNANILFASYGYECYSGDAFVLLDMCGNLYEVNGGHCSCYGLEGQWEPEETSLEALRYRLTNGHMGVDSYSGNEYASELKQFLGIE